LLSLVAVFRMVAKDSENRLYLSSISQLWRGSAMEHNGSEPPSR
jgi:hypothetical protein